MNTITASTATARPAAKRSLRLLAGLTLAASSLIGALSTNASAAEATAPAPTAAAAVQAPATPPGGGSIQGAGTSNERVSPKALYWRQIWARTVYDPYGSYRNYYSTACRNSTYPYSWYLTWTRGSYKTYRCHVLTRI